MSKQPHKSMTLEWRRVREYKGEKLWTDFKRKQKRQIKQPHHTRFPASVWRSGRFTINWQKDNTARDCRANTLLDAHTNIDHQWLKLNNGDIFTCDSDIYIHPSSLQMSPDHSEELAAFILFIFIPTFSAFSLVSLCPRPLWNHQLTPNHKAEVCTFPFWTHVTSEPTRHTWWFFNVLIRFFSHTSPAQSLLKYLPGSQLLLAATLLLVHRLPQIQLQLCSKSPESGSWS